jgi:PTH2 family peptidyl-tRNA hydrolase
MQELETKTDKVKQVIVMRIKYPDGKGGTTGLRKGKLISQGSHASMSFLVKRLQTEVVPVWTEPELEWLEGSFAKICVSVDTEEELLEIYKKAKDAELEVHLITDLGRTEFNGVPTNTCLAIGPDYSSKIDSITGDLTLL